MALLPGFLTTAMRPIPAAHRGVANGIFFMASLTGGAIGIAIAGLLLKNVINITAREIIHSTSMIFITALMIALIMLALTAYGRCTLSTAWKARTGS